MAGTEMVPVESYRALDPATGSAELLRSHLQENEVNEFDLTRIKVPTGGALQWQVPTLEGEEARKTITGVVVGSKNTRSWWHKKYEGGSDQPDCSSPDARLATAQEGFDIPAERSESGELICDTCDYSSWGSAEGSRGQACKLMRQLFLLTSEKLLPMVVNLPPTSLKPAGGYFLGLVDYGIDQKHVITEIGLEKVSAQGVPDYARATFRVAERIEDPAAIGRIEEYAAALEPMLSRVRVASREETGE